MKKVTRNCDVYV